MSPPVRAPRPCCVAFCHARTGKRDTRRTEDDPFGHAPGLGRTEKRPAPCGEKKETGQMEGILILIGFAIVGWIAIKFYKAPPPPP